MDPVTETGRPWAVGRGAGASKVSFWALKEGQRLLHTRASAQTVLLRFRNYRAVERKRNVCLIRRHPDEGRVHTTTMTRGGCARREAAMA